MIIHNSSYPFRKYAKFLRLAHQLLLGASAGATLKTLHLMNHEVPPSCRTMNVSTNILYTNNSLVVQD